MNPVALAVLYFIASLLIATFGRKRKWGFWGYLWASMLFSPFLGLLFVLAGDTYDPDEDPPPLDKRGRR
ncbi:MAG: hypothetical protein JNJ60_14385 [Rhodocyclaceae bacterium]|nr:hypothetical protein [Rhodocyclaceae bacterium]